MAFELSRRQYYRILAGFMVFLCVLSIGLATWVINSSGSAHAEATHQQIYGMKKRYLHDTVHNVMGDIDELRAGFRQIAKNEVARAFRDLDLWWNHDQAGFPDATRILLADKSLQDKVAFSVNLIPSGHTVFKNLPRGLEIPAPGGEARIYGNWKIYLLPRTDWADDQAKAAITRIIHQKKFENDSYIWVNEVLDWSGGDNYAIRRIHPNLRDTEDSFLSTSMKDIKGNTPYQTELDGVRKDGEIWFTYWFKRMNSQEVAEKLTYSSLYKDFGWIVAMGVYLGDLQSYIDVADEESRPLVVQAVVIALAVFLLLFLGGTMGILGLERWYLARTSRLIKEESNKDALTGIFNRRVGDHVLADAFRSFQARGLSPALLFFDIDDFKKVNDHWGHDAGDLVLQSVVNRAKQTMRASDALFRWGGEEFLLVGEGIVPANAETLARKLCQNIALSAVGIGPAGMPHQVNVTVSVGISWFEPGDGGPQDALKRADKALYQAKHEGKNCVRLSLRKLQA